MEKLPQEADTDFHAAKILGHLGACGLMLSSGEKGHRTRPQSQWAHQGDYGPQKATETVDVMEGLLLLFCLLHPIPLLSDSILSLGLANHLALLENPRAT